MLTVANWHQMYVDCDMTHWFVYYSCETLRLVLNSGRYLSSFGLGEADEHILTEFLVQEEMSEGNQNH